MWEDLITAAATKWKLDGGLLASQVQYESAGNALAIGDGGRALGLMQVHLVACQDIGRAVDWYKLQTQITGKLVAEAAALGLDLGCEYLARMVTRFGNLGDALMAYNQGPTVVGKAVAYRDAVMGKKA